MVKPPIKMDAAKKVSNAKILARVALKAMDSLTLSPKLERKGRNITGRTARVRKWDILTLCGVICAYRVTMW